jgi:PPOX class probable F420-dependent enzyme
MDIGQALDIIRSQHHAVLATTRADGLPQMSPVLAAVDDEDYVTISTREPAFKVRNVRRQPRASLCVLPDRFFGGTWLQVEGPAQILSLPDAMEPLVEYYRSVSGEHPDWDEYRQAMERDRRCLIRIRVERAGPDREG